MKPVEAIPPPFAAELFVIVLPKKTGLQTPGYELNIKIPPPLASSVLFSEITLLIKMGEHVEFSPHLIKTPPPPSNDSLLRTMLPIILGLAVE